MQRMVAAITSLPQHFDALRDRPEVYRPASCPRCGFGRLWLHGCYQRKADRQSLSTATRNSTPVLRFCCVSCRRTCSRLPGCLAPRRWYDWALQQAALLALLLGNSVRRCHAALRPARSTLRRWRDWLQARHDEFAFHLRSRFPEWGRAVDRCAFWQTCLAQQSLAGAMSWLDRQINVP
jgi:hypothetical protein